MSLCRFNLNYSIGIGDTNLGLTWYGTERNVLCADCKTLVQGNLVELKLI